MIRVKKVLINSRIKDYFIEQVEWINIKLMEITAFFSIYNPYFFFVSKFDPFIAKAMADQWG